MRKCELLRGSVGAWSCSSWLQELVGVTFPGRVLSNLCRATATHHCITAGHQPARNGQAHDPHFPKAAAEEQLCNTVQFFYKTAFPASLAQEVHIVMDQSCCQGEEEGLGWFVGKNSWQASEILVQLARLHQLGGRQGGYYCRQKAKEPQTRAAFWIQTVAILTRPWSQGFGGLNDRGADKRRKKQSR